MNLQIPMAPSWSWILGLMFGAAIGSFLNVVIYRLPRGVSLSNPPKSFCPNCKHSLGVADLFPLFSWLLSRGKCRYCAQPIASRYFWVELLNGSLWAVIWWQYVIVSFEPVRAAFYALTCAALVAVIFIDWELYIIPDELNAILLLFGVAFHWFDKSLMVALWGSLLGWGLLWGIALFGRVLFRKDAMGHGDIKMMRGVGALLGPALLCANMAIAVVAGLVIGILLMAIASKSQPNATQEGAEEDYAPESIVSLFIHGAWYLLCLDIVGVFVPTIYKLIGETPSEENIEEDDWKPSLTTIPFGPYLAIGAIVCMLFSAGINQGIANYLKSMGRQAAIWPRSGKEFVVIGPKRLNWSAAQGTKRSQTNHEFGNHGARRKERGGIDWNVTMTVSRSVRGGNKGTKMAVTLRGESGVRDAC